MKKALSLLFALFLVITLTSCSNKKTSIESEEEWKSLFTTDKFRNILIEERDLIDNEEYVATIANFDNIIKIEMTYGEDTDSTYYELDEDNNSINCYSLIGEDTYYCEKQEYINKETSITEFDSYLNSFMYYIDFSDQYENIEYDEEKKCYSFDYTMYESYEVNVNVYIENDKVVKQVITGVDGRVTVITYKQIFEAIKLPNIDNDVNSKEEWASLFRPDKYNNCISYVLSGNNESMTYIDDNIINRIEYDVTTESFNNIYYIYDSTTNKETILKDNEEGTFDEIIATYNANDKIKSFSDRKIAYTTKGDYSGDYDLTTKVDDHYELTKENLKLEIYVSGEYIYKINATNLDNGITEEISLYSYGVTVVEDPRTLAANQE